MTGKTWSRNARSKTGN